MTKWFFAAGVIVLSFAACKKDEDTNQLNDTDRTFVLQASIGNTAEVGAANLAMSKATTPAVMAYAQHMVMEHTLTQTDLKSVGTDVGLTVTDTLNPAHVAIMAQLSALTGRAFDSMYIHSQVADHTTTLTFFQNEQNNGRHSRVRGYADTYLPHIQLHLSRADSIATNLF